MCLVCQETIAVMKISNLKRYETKHGNFEETFPQNSEVRTTTINALKWSYFNRVTQCSLRVVWILGKHKKPFSDAEIIKECMTEVMDTMFEGKQKEEIFDYVFLFMSKWKWHFILVCIFVVLNEKDILFWMLQYYCMWPDRPQHMDLFVALYDFYLSPPALERRGTPDTSPDVLPLRCNFCRPRRRKRQSMPSNVAICSFSLLGMQKILGYVRLCPPKRGKIRVHVWAAWKNLWTGTAFARQSAISGLQMLRRRTQTLNWDTASESRTDPKWGWRPPGGHLPTSFKISPEGIWK